MKPKKLPIMVKKRLIRSLKSDPSGVMTMPYFTKIMIEFGIDGTYESQLIWAQLEKEAYPGEMH